MARLTRSYVHGASGAALMTFLKADDLVADLARGFARLDGA